MFENDAKGSYGSYSNFGKVSLRKFPMVIDKEKILKGQYKKKEFKDYFSREEENEADKIYVNEGVDIFDKPKKKNQKKASRYQALCTEKEKANVATIYKSHYFHHLQLTKINSIIKKQNFIAANLQILAPKKDITWRRTLTGPNWDSVTGREKYPLFKKKNNYVDTFYISHHNYLSNIKKKEHECLTERNNSKKKKHSGEKKKKKTKINKSDESKKEISKDKSKTTDKKKDIKLMSINKGLSRNRNHMEKKLEGVGPICTPNYKLVEPRSLSMVVYNLPQKKKIITNRMEGIESYFLYDPNKALKYTSNYKACNSPNLAIMLGRNNTDIKDHLPIYLRSINDRNSLEFLTEKALIMNGYLGNDMINDYSSFNRKKSHNSFINYNILKGCTNIKETKLDRLNQKFRFKNKIRNIMEFYSKNLDCQNILRYHNQFDGITFKTMKHPDVLTEREKRMFTLTNIKN